MDVDVMLSLKIPSGRPCTMYIGPATVTLSVSTIIDTRTSVITDQSWTRGGRGDDFETLMSREREVY